MNWAWGIGCPDFGCPDFGLGINCCLQCPMPNAQCPMPNAQSTIHNPKLILPGASEGGDVQDCFISWDAQDFINLVVKEAADAADS